MTTVLLVSYLVKYYILFKTSKLLKTDLFLNLLFHFLFNSSYSHSNHVEMGKLTQLNELIGTVEFNNQAFVSPTEINACNGNCNLISVPCSTLAKILSSLLSFAGYQSTITSCPLQYFNCTNNIGILDKLLSGYYTGQALTDGVS